MYIKILLSILFVLTIFLQLSSVNGNNVVSYTMGPEQCTNGTPLLSCNLTLTDIGESKLIGLVRGPCCPGYNSTHINYATWLAGYVSTIPINYTGYDVLRGPYHIQFTTFVNNKVLVFNELLNGFRISRITRTERLGAYFYIKAWK
ncbi:hypothetical protein PPL_09277 [Heterostelium album PN500]|uniref:Uncharacterized protein n=1 Tax=Heterostelium pallidum (strain ATCC 26659 / Pp 5 / PN500) TaxID=670386 RepID=D3BL45_HETP5|nr:hypothetical protein PPL_09277 [Heterostelium album PN500]EFA77779.1 hypothetical protein PPL_09277 [Heterostelium album PN500]|eukprot:XP_020429907.1 hypothetical protein PPL_09277 [Heterostelium album PN500]